MRQGVPNQTELSSASVQSKLRDLNTLKQKNFDSFFIQFLHLHRDILNSCESPSSAMQTQFGNSASTILNIFYRYALFKNIKQPSGELKDTFDHCDFNDVDRQIFSKTKQFIEKTHQAAVKLIESYQARPILLQRAESENSFMSGSTDSSLTSRSLDRRFKTPRLSDNNSLTNDLDVIINLINKDDSLYIPVKQCLQSLCSIQSITDITRSAQGLSELMPAHQFFEFRYFIEEKLNEVKTTEIYREIDNLFRLIHYPSPLTINLERQNTGDLSVSPMTTDSDSSSRSFTPISRRNSSSPPNLANSSSPTLFIPNRQTNTDKDEICSVHGCTVS